MSKEEGRRPQHRTAIFALEANERLNGLLRALFQAHDLNKNGVIEEIELIQLNRKIAVLHYGKNVDLDAVKLKYQELFRRALNANGEPVPFETFRDYMLQVLVDLDPDAYAQEMILEQFLAEACAARAAFHIPSLSCAEDAPFLSTISFDEANTLDGVRSEPGLRSCMPPRGHPGRCDTPWSSSP